jgi:hypothetical protein
VSGSEPAGPGARVVISNMESSWGNEASSGMGGAFWQMAGTLPAPEE